MSPTTQLPWRGSTHELISLKKFLGDNSRAGMDAGDSLTPSTRTNSGPPDSPLPEQSVPTPGGGPTPPVQSPAAPAPPAERSCLDVPDELMAARSQNARKFGKRSLQDTAFVLARSLAEDLQRNASTWEQLGVGYKYRPGKDEKSSEPLSLSVSSSSWGADSSASYINDGFAAQCPEELRYNPYLDNSNSQESMGSSRSQQQQPQQRQQPLRSPASGAARQPEVLDWREMAQESEEGDESDGEFALFGAIGSEGTLLHHTACCRPCVYMLTRTGCSNGSKCRFCHAPVHAKNKGAMRLRRRRSSPSRSASASVVRPFPEPQPTPLSSQGTQADTAATQEDTLVRVLKENREALQEKMTQRRLAGTAASLERMVL